MKELPATHQRFPAIDLMRGIVIVLMALDHTRDFLGASSIDPRNTAEPLLFMTRWITHFCAPVFAFLAGASARFAMGKYSKAWLASRSLTLRGIWLIVLELTLVRFAWTFVFSFSFILLQVLWALGVGMVFLSFLTGLPPSLVGVTGAVMILSHNLLDSIQAASLGPASWIWHLLHEPHLVQLASGQKVWALYPLIPWVGVMALGFSFAPNLAPHARRSRFFYTWGATMVALFMVLRFTGAYGDPHPWQPQTTLLASLLEFVNCEKYPPSLQFLLMTLGPMLVAYPLISRIRGAAAIALLTFGREPMLFYVLHIPLIHALAVLLAAWNHNSTTWLFGGFPLLNKPAEYGMPLYSIYLFWLLILLALYPLSRWYGSEKSIHRQWWHKLL